MKTFNITEEQINEIVRTGKKVTLKVLPMVAQLKTKFQITNKN